MLKAVHLRASARQLKSPSKRGRRSLFVPVVAEACMSLAVSTLQLLREGDAVAYTVATFLAFWALNIFYVYLTAPSATEARRRVNYVLLQHPRDAAVVTARWWILAEAMRTTPAFWLLVWPLVVFEAISVQLLADLYEGRPLKGTLEARTHPFTTHSRLARLCRNTLTLRLVALEQDRRGTSGASISRS